MTIQYTTTAHTNVQFIVTKSICNANGYLLPHILFNRIKTIASYPVKELYSGPIPDISDYTLDRKSTRLNSSHVKISYAVFCLKKKKQPHRRERRTGRQRHP